MTEYVHIGDCLNVLDTIDRESVDLVYVDPPFFTQSIHRLQTRDGKKQFSFTDIWSGDHSYSEFILQRLTKVREKLKPTGTVFFHCDKTASHTVRFILESVFGSENFQSEIIWSFRRWSNAKHGLLNSHQTIYFFSKGQGFKFFPMYQGYSPSTNVDQIMQKRERDARNKTVYSRQDSGQVISSGTKRGVPLGDVWEIPYLNPKAKERTGYPTQKPVILLKRIIQLATAPEDVVLDPFCGSGTTLVAAQALGRKAIGIDISPEAVQLTKERLHAPIISESSLLEKGRDAYRTHDRYAAGHLACVDYTPVHRNRGIDGILKQEIGGRPVLLRVQRKGESQDQTAQALIKASKKNKGDCLLVVIATKKDLMPPAKYPNVEFVRSTSLSLGESDMSTEQDDNKEHRVMVTEV